MRGMARASEERIRERRGEILGACERLYRERSFKEVTIKEISKETSFSRPSIYNYFETREEIFLALLQREYESWTEGLRRICGGEELSREELSEGISRSLSERELLLRIQAMNLYEIEEHSREERLEDYKRVYLSAVEEIRRCLRRTKPPLSEEEMRDFIYAFFPFMYGIYPYVHPTCKQCRAMDRVGISHPETDIYTICRRFLRRMLGRRS